MARKKAVGDPAAEALLTGAAADAVRFLLDTMLNDGEKTDLRIKCAGEILDRVCGDGDEGPRVLEVILGPAAELSE